MNANSVKAKLKSFMISMCFQQNMSFLTKILEMQSKRLSRIGRRL